MRWPAEAAAAALGGEAAALRDARAGRKALRSCAHKAVAGSCRLTGRRKRRVLRRLALSLAFIFFYPFQRPWYDVMIIALLALYPSSALDVVVLARLCLGAITYMEKAVDRDSLADTFTAIGQATQPRVKKLLVICGDRKTRDGGVQMLAAPDLDVIEAVSGTEGLEIGSRHMLDGIVIHLELEDMPALHIASKIQSRGPGGNAPAPMRF